MMSESISENGFMTQGHVQGQMSWSMSCKLAQQLLDLQNPSACFDLSLNDVVSIIF